MHVVGCFATECTHCKNEHINSTKLIVILVAGKRIDFFSNYDFLYVGSDSVTL